MPANSKKHPQFQSKDSNHAISPIHTNQKILHSPQKFRNKGAAEGVGAGGSQNKSPS